jgi:ABC-type Na+ efflux pump permease subunit
VKKETDKALALAIASVALAFLGVMVAGVHFAPALAGQELAVEEAHAALHIIVGAVFVLAALVCAFLSLRARAKRKHDGPGDKGNRAG